MATDAVHDKERTTLQQKLDAGEIAIDEPSLKDGATYIQRRNSIRMERFRRSGEARITGDDDQEMLHAARIHEIVDALFELKYRADVKKGKCLFSKKQKPLLMLAS